MGKYLIQTYNREMTELISTEEVDNPLVEDVLSRAYDMSDLRAVIVVWRRNSNDPTRLRLIAKFY